MQDETSSVATLVTGIDFAEGLRWHDGRLWYSDFHRHGVFACSADGAEERILTLDDSPSGLVRLPDGRLRIAGLTVIEVSRLARDHDLLLTHLSAAMASLEERFAAITEQHVDYRAGLHPAAAR